ncbi:MAG: glutamate racemase [Bacteroidetes bacterium]|nr:glutamate racemase [Bacteroidota bacterium]
MKSQHPIGLFDSGVGGTTIWSEIHKLMPYENTIYLADSKYAPYGNRPAEEIIRLSIKNVEKLIAFDCKIIIVACNTATTNAIEVLREKFSIPFIGIEPPIKPAALQSKTKRIGVLATKGTLSSTHFNKASKNYTNTVDIIEVIGKQLVTLIEAGEIDSPKIINLLKEYTAPMIAANVDHVVLGCTHYPYLTPILRQILPSHVQITHSGEAVARQTKKVLTDNKMLDEKNEKPFYRFHTNGNARILKSLLQEYSDKIEISTLDF